MHTGSGDSTIHTFTILFTGIVGTMIHITVMDIHPGILRTVRGIWDGVAVGIHLIAIGDGDIRHIIVPGTGLIHPMDGVTHIIIHIMGTVGMEVMEIITGISDM